MSPAVSLPEASRGPSLAITFVHPTAFWDLSKKNRIFRRSEVDDLEYLGVFRSDRILKPWDP